MTIDAKPTAPPLEEVVATSADTETSEAKQPPLVASAPPAAETATKGATELDLVFCCDCTGSMSAYLRSAQENIISISQAINDAVGSKLEVRYGLIKYRDHPPQDKTFITEVFPFTKKIQMMKKFVDTMEAAGGGDGPEAVAAALHEADVMEWRPNSVKVCVLIADAPPHGLGESGDGFPNGCPLGYDPINICRSLAAKGVVVYAVGVEPVLSTSYKNARDFMMCVAKITDGKFLPLGKADILSKVIVNSCLENIDMTDFWATLEQEVEKETAGKKVTAEAKVELLERKMKERAATKECRQVEVENPYMAGYDFSNVNRMMAATSLKSAVPMLEYSRNADVSKKVAGFKWSEQEFSAPACSAVTEEQCERVAFRAKKKAGIF